MFENYEKIEPHLKPNLIKLPITYLSLEDFNNLCRSLLSLQRNGLKRFEFTPSGGICKKKLYLPSWNWKKAGNGIELIILSNEGFFRARHMMNKYVTMDNKGGTKKYISPKYAFNTFTSICKQFGIDLEEYKINNGKEVKKEIEKTMICMAHPRLEGENKYYIGHHIDRHSAWPASLVEKHNEFKKPIEYIYKQKEEEKRNGANDSNNVYKAILNYSIGWMQSVDCCKAQWAHLSRDAINDNNKWLLEMKKELEDNGRFVLSFNTDGIWYTGDVYHGKGEGRELGQWDNDHINCKIRFKSAGSYEYIEDGVYHPVVRGKTKLEETKPREFWEWGDIFAKGADEIIKYQFIDSEDFIGIIEEESEEYEF